MLGLGLGLDPALRPESSGLGLEGPGLGLAGPGLGLEGPGLGLATPGLVNIASISSRAKGTKVHVHRPIYFSRWFCPD